MPKHMVSPSEILAEVTERSEAAEVVTVDIERHLLAILEHLLQLKKLDLMNVFMISEREIRYLLEVFEQLDRDPHTIQQEIELIRKRLAAYSGEPDGPQIALAESSAPPAKPDTADTTAASEPAVDAKGPRIGLSKGGSELILACLRGKEGTSVELLKHKFVNNKDLVKQVIVDLKRIALHRAGSVTPGYVGLTRRAVGMIDGNRLTDARVWGKLIGLFFKAGYVDEQTREWLLNPMAEPPKPEPSKLPADPIDETVIGFIRGLMREEGNLPLLEEIGVNKPLADRIRSAIQLISVYRASPTYFPADLKPLKESTRAACQKLGLQPRDPGSAGLWNMALKAVFEAGLVDRRQYYLYLGKPVLLEAHRETCQLIGFVFRQESDPAASLREACAEYWQDMPGWDTKVKFVYKIHGRVRTTELAKGIRAIEDAIGKDGSNRGFLIWLISEVVSGFSELRHHPGDALLMEYPDGATADLQKAFAQTGAADDAYWSRILTTLVKWGVMLLVEADSYLKEISAE